MKSKIYTKRGDEGQTGLVDGYRLSKDDLLIECYGHVDELDCMLGIVLSHTDLPETVQKILQAIISKLPHVIIDLYPVGSELIKPEDICVLESWIDQYDQTLPPLNHFIRPIGKRVSVECHLARTVCRRTERRLVSLHQQSPFNPNVLRYINRLSDLLFVLARVLNQ